MGQTKRNQKWAYVFYIWACIVRKCGQAGVRVCDLLCYCLWCCTQEMKIFPFCFMGTQDCHRMYVLADPRLFNLSTLGLFKKTEFWKSMRAHGSCGAKLFPEFNDVFCCEKF